MTDQERRWREYTKASLQAWRRYDEARARGDWPAVNAADAEARRLEDLARLARVEIEIEDEGLGEQGYVEVVDAAE